MANVAATTLVGYRIGSWCDGHGRDEAVFSATATSGLAAGATLAASRDQSHQSTTLAQLNLAEMLKLLMHL